MSGVRGWAAVTGVAERKPTRWTDGETTIDMFARIGVEAIADAGLQLADIDGLICHPMGGVPMLVPSTLLRGDGHPGQLRRDRRPRWRDRGRHGVAGRRGHPRRPGPGRAVRDRLPPPAAARAGAGAEGVGAPQRRRPGHLGVRAEFEVPYGNVGANVGYAMIAQRYLHEQGATPEQLAKIAVHQRDNACANPDAFFYGQPITIDDVLDSPVVADPLHMLEIVMPSAGAAALVVVHPDLARDARRPGQAALAARRRRVRHPQDDHLRAEP